MTRVLLGMIAVLMAAPAIAGGAAIVAYRITDGREIAGSLTGAPGNPARGRTLFHDRGAAGCVRCHTTGGAGPGLEDMAGRRTPGEFRLWIVAPQVFDPETGMPGFYAAGQRAAPDDPLYGGPLLRAADIEDLVAYLLTAGDPG